MADRVLNRAAFVFATPFGLQPSPAFEEFLHSEVYEVGRAVDVLRSARVRINQLRGAIVTPLEHLVDEIPTQFQEGCIGSCILAAWCEGNRGGQAAVLGDAAVDLLGQDTPINRAMQLIAGVPPTTPRERELQRILIDAARALGRAPTQATA